MVEVQSKLQVSITLPDGSVREFTAPVTGADVAADIGPGLAKAALAVRVDGEMRDLSRPVEGDAELSIVTAKDKDALELIRHDAAHVMAQAVDSEGLEPAEPYLNMIGVLRRDAEATSAAVKLVLAQDGISSQLIDNLNASIHVRALLTDLFLLDEVLGAV